LYSVWNDFLNLIFPARPFCPLCGEHSPDKNVCGRCRSTLDSYLLEHRCRKCGRFPGKGAVLAGSPFEHLCFECRKHKWPFALARAVGPYEGILKDSIHRYKYARRRVLALTLAPLMAEAYRAEPLYTEIGLILPVPLSGEKLRDRGFNQAALLAKELSVLLQIPADVRTLVKKFETPPQAGLPRAARESNLKDAFDMIKAEKVNGKNILLIDDVFTTGSTLSAVASVIRLAGAKHVFGLTAATGRYF